MKVYSVSTSKLYSFKLKFKSFYLSWAIVQLVVCLFWIINWWTLSINGRIGSILANGSDTIQILSLFNTQSVQGFYEDGTKTNSGISFNAEFKVTGWFVTIVHQQSEFAQLWYSSRNNCNNFSNYLLKSWRIPSDGSIESPSWSFNFPIFKTDPAVLYKHCLMNDVLAWWSGCI